MPFSVTSLPSPFAHVEQLVVAACNRAFLAEQLRERGAVVGVGKRPRERLPRPRLREQADAGLQILDQLRIGQQAEQRDARIRSSQSGDAAFVVRDRELRVVRVGDREERVVADRARAVAGLTS